MGALMGNRSNTCCNGSVWRLAFSLSRPELQRRIKRILQQTLPRPGGWILVSAVTAMVIGFAVFSFGQVQEKDDDKSQTGAATVEAGEEDLPAISRSTHESGSARAPFPAEIEAYPDLALADLVLNRLPFQQFNGPGSIAWADDGNTLVTSCGDGILSHGSGLFAWDVASREPRRWIREPGNVSMSQDGTRLVVRGKNARILSWPSLELQQTFELSEYHTTNIKALSPDGRFLALSYMQSVNHGHLYVYDVKTGKQMFLRKGPVMDTLAWDPESRFLAVGESRGIVIFFSPEGKLIRPGIRLDPVEAPTGLAVSPDGRLLAVCTKESMGVYEVRGRRKVWYENPEHATSKHPRGRNRWISFNANGTELLANTYDLPGRDESVFRARDPRSGEVFREGTAYKYGNVSLSPDRQIIAYRQFKGSVALYKTDTFELITPQVTGDGFDHPYRIGPSSTPSVRPSPDGKTVVVSGLRHVTMWDLRSGQKRWWRNAPEQVRDAAWHPDGEWIATVRNGRNTCPPSAGSAVSDPPQAFVELLEPADGHVLQSFSLEDEAGGPVLVLGDGRIVACGNHHAYLFDATGQMQWKTPLANGDDKLNDIAVDPDESLLAIVHQNGRTSSSYLRGGGSIFLLDVETGGIDHELASLATPSRVAFTADGERVIASTCTTQGRGDIRPLLETWIAETGERQDMVDIPELPHRRVEYEEIVVPLLKQWPLLYSQRMPVVGVLGGSPDRRLVVIEKPIEPHETGDASHVRRSPRILLWDIDQEKALAYWHLPCPIDHAAILPDGRVVTLNKNGTLFVLRRPE
jgi:WD40 repeat protein